MQDFRRDKNNRINQGDIFRDIIHIENIEEHENELIVSRIRYPYVVVLSQDCDLREDSVVRSKQINDKALISVLAAPLYNFDQFLNGEHLQDLGIITSAEISKNPSKSNHKNLVNNQTPRYHYLDGLEAQLPKFVIDFKHYFSISVSYLQKIRRTNYEYPLAYLHREKLSQRFANYLSRIGLP